MKTPTYIIHIYTWPCHYSDCHSTFEGHFYRPLVQLNRKHHAVCVLHLHTPISHNIKTTCFISRQFVSPKTALIHLGRYAWLLGVSCGVWHRDICSGSFRSCGLDARPSMNQTGFCTAHRCLSGWNLGTFVIGLRPWALCHIPWAIPDQLLWCVRAHCPEGGTMANS